MRCCLQGPALHRAVAGVLARHLPPPHHRAWIVGSEARHSALPGSDVDIAIEGPEKIDLVRLAAIRGDLEALPTIRSFDLVDLGRASATFRDEALSAAIPLLPGPAEADDESA